MTTFPQKVAIVHEWLENYAGSESVVAELIRLFPQCDLFALVDFMPEASRFFLQGKSVQTSFLQKLPGARKNFRNYLPLFPTAIERFDLHEYDLVISSSHAVAKGIKTGEHQKHICYCHTPMRYIWDLQEEYLEQSGLNMRPLKRILTQLIFSYLRKWDKKTAGNPDMILANSSFVQERIKRVWGRESIILHPPVDTDYFVPSDIEKEDYYVSVSRFVPNKRMDLIAEAFAKMPDKKVVMIGDGPQWQEAKDKAPPNVVLKGHIRREEIRKHLQKAKAFVFASLEDFGIAPVEAMACGTPVIAYGKGGVLDSVIEGKTGVLYPEQNAESLRQGVFDFEETRHLFSKSSIRREAENYSRQSFQSGFKSELKRISEAISAKID